MKTEFKVDETVLAVNNEPLEGNTKAPKLEVGKKYTIKGIIQDKEGNDHIDVGLVSELEYVTSWETKEELPDGDSIHWCHPSRFTKNYE